MRPSLDLNHYPAAKPLVPIAPDLEIHVIREKLFTDSTFSQDIISGDEIISDSYDMTEVDGIVYEIDCAMIVEGAVSVSEYPLNPTIVQTRLPFLTHQYRHWCQRFRRGG